MTTPADRLNHLAGIVRRLEADYRQVSGLVREHMERGATLAADLPVDLAGPAAAILARSPHDLEATPPEDLDRAGIPTDLVAQILAAHRAAAKHEGERQTLSGRLRDARLLFDACRQHAARQGISL